MWYLSHLMSGKLFAISSTRSSQYGMVMAMPFDLVAEVRCFFGVLRASSKANFSTRSTPMRRQHRLLHHDLALGARKHAAADRRVFALGVLAHHPEVDVAGLAAGQRRRHAGHQPHRAQIDVLVELAAEQDERAPQRDVIRHLGRPADRAEEDRVVLADLLLPVVRHHLAVLFVVVAGGEIEIVAAQLEAEFLRRGLQHAHALRHDLLADAVARDDGDAMDAVGGHERGSCCDCGRHRSAVGRGSECRGRALRRAARTGARPSARRRGLAVELHAEDTRRGPPGRSGVSRSARLSRIALEPAELQAAAEDRRADAALDVIAALAPVEARLAEHAAAPGGRGQIGAERREKPLARGRHLAAVVAQHHMAARDQRVGDRDAHAAGQMVVAGAGEAQRLVLGRARPVARRHLDRGDRLDAFQHARRPAARRCGSRRSGACA